MSDRQVWQIGAGSSGRYYSDLFLAHDVMFLGPGRFGPYEFKMYEKSDWHVKTALNGLHSFCDIVQPGDFVVARNGHYVVAIGMVADEPYLWNEAFDDIHGWDLQHTRRIAWLSGVDLELKQLQSDKRPLFGHMKQIPTFTRLNHEITRKALAPFFDRLLPRDLKPLPVLPPPPLTLEEVGRALFAAGVANDAVDKVVLAITRQRRLLDWYNTTGTLSGRPTEHEVVAHMVLPILLALGWSEQLLAIEWNKIDLAVFGSTPTTKETCALVCEAKTAGHGLQDVRKQAYDYTDNLGLTNCRKVMVTEGGRFYLYERDGENWNLDTPPKGYLNLSQIRTSHVCPSNTNAIDTLVSMTPAGVLRG